jgi:hypothetical protein
MFGHRNLRSFLATERIPISEKERKKEEREKERERDLGVVVQVYNPSTREKEAEGSQISGQPGQYDETLSQKQKTLKCSKPKRSSHISLPRSWNHRCMPLHLASIVFYTHFFIQFS